jgi:Domain of unknown function (DUF4153)
MESNRPAFFLLIMAVLLGVAADLLLREIPWGVNLPIWLTFLIAGAYLYAQRNHRLLPDGGTWILVALAIVPWFMAWRDSPMLAALTIGLIVAGCGVLVVRTPSGRLYLAGLMDLVLGVIISGVHIIVGLPVLLFGDIRWNNVAPGGGARHALALTRGVILATPIIILFGTLFSSADAVFHSFVRTIFDFDIEAIVRHGMWIGFFTWIVGGYLRGLNTTAPLITPQPPGQRLSLGILEIGTVLGLLNVLFLLFVIIQVEYLFGGAPHVRLTPGLTYAEYARSGFFELVAVSALLLPLLLLCHYLLRKSEHHGELVFRLLAGTLIGLLFVVMMSAVQRMLVYVAEFGLTELRFYTTAFMGWLGVVFVIFVLTVVRGRREYFAFATLLSGFVAVTVFYLLNPDGRIAEINISRVKEGHGLDPAYIASLSDDAVPHLVNALPEIEEPYRTDLRTLLLQHHGSQEEIDWRTWNLSRQEARAAMSRLMISRPVLRTPSGNINSPENTENERQTGK